MYSLSFDKKQSSLIKQIDWEEKILTVWFHSYYTDKLSHENVPFQVFERLANHESKGKYYLHSIKLNYKIMADKPKTVNKAGDHKRFIDISIDVTKVDKSFLHVGEKGTYLHMTLQMLPDGTIDAYGNLGMVTQKVPTKIWKAAPKDKKPQGAILGNAAEFEREGVNSEGAPGASWEPSNDAVSSVMDDLPF